MNWRFAAPDRLVFRVGRLVFNQELFQKIGIAKCRCFQEGQNPLVDQSGRVVIHSGVTLAKLKLD